MLALTALFAWLVVVYPARPGRGQGEVRSLEVAPHASLSEVADQLARAELVRRPWLFQLYAFAMGASRRLRSGTILLRDSMGPRELLQRLATGYGQTVLKITLPEGYTRFDVADRLSAWNVVSRDDFLSVSENPVVLSQLGVPGSTAEGYLFPDTYQFLDESDPTQVLERLVRTGQRRLDALVADPAGGVTLPTDLGLDRHDVIILASVVEKEAAVPEEQAVIAGVFLNRLRDPAFKPKRLQADPTVAYGCRVQPELESCQGFDGRRVTRRMTSDANNSYNTYRIEGLPPGPIANPGLAAIRAVLFPAQHDYLYFVSQGGGRHRFSSNLEEHNGAVDALRRLQ